VAGGQRWDGVACIALATLVSHGEEPVIQAEPHEAAVALTRSLPWKGLAGLVDPFFLGFPGMDRDSCTFDKP